MSKCNDFKKLSEGNFGMYIYNQFTFGANLLCTLRLRPHLINLEKHKNHYNSEYCSSTSSSTPTLKANTSWSQPDWLLPVAKCLIKCKTNVDETQKTIIGKTSTTYYILK